MSIISPELKRLGKTISYLVQHTILLPSIYYGSSSKRTHYTFPFSLSGFPSATFDVADKKWTRTGNRNNINREEGTTVLLPLTPADYAARILNSRKTTIRYPGYNDDVEKIDFSNVLPTLIMP
jgi:hypothetical protein